MKANMAFLLEKMPFAYRVLDFDFIMAINEQKAKIFAEGGIILNTNPQIDDDGIQTLPVDKIGINKNIFYIFKILKKLKDYDYSIQKCKDFLYRYKQELEDIDNLKFDDMSLNECKKFIEYSYNFTQNLAYDRFKYALFPLVLNSKKLTKIIKKVDVNYSSFDFYWDLDNKTSVVTNDIYKMADEIRKNEALKNSIISGESFKKIY